ncbi:MAG TPA: FAD-dependent oxidoreductase, partial [Acidobacteriaceae bacterium]|nr:FAD-dependent oxidoreductase [Acidobacteriaceae bacterium]
LGAAHRLIEIGDVAVQVYDQNLTAGGLASSFIDNNGFTWDIGGHVQFSHYRYFDDLMGKLLGDEWVEHVREAWIWMRERFIPYPLQNNIHLLPRDDFELCIRGLVATLKQSSGPVSSFRAWIEASFGTGLAQIFMFPYNFKVWAHDPAAMCHEWVGERVATVDLCHIIHNIIDGKPEMSWGPNNHFRFPLRGGTGQIWRTLAATLPDGVFLPGRRCTGVNTKKHVAWFDDGGHQNYDILISTIPLDQFISVADIDPLKCCISEFRYSTVHVIGIGLKGSTPPHLKTKCWMYFPEGNCPFYRATVFSNYSPNNVPDSNRYWSLMVEVSESPFKPVDRSRLLESVVQGLISTQLIESQGDIASVWMHTACHGYPTPFMGRDRVVSPVLAELAQLDIYSRGRFGGWKYEVSNQDHSLMQGVELVNRLAFSTPEMTYWYPAVVNGLPR